MSKIKVMLVDDHDLVRMGIRRLLEDTSAVDVVAEACSGEEAIEQARKADIDVILMDINMPGIGGFEATSRLTQLRSDIKIIVITVHSDGPLPKRLLEAGAVGYLTKGCDVNEMLAAIKKVHSGKKYIASEIAQQLALSMLPGDESPLETLSQRELQVLIMISQGLRTTEISEKLNLSPKTISTYRKRLREKLEVTNDVEMLRLAIQYGLTEDTQDPELLNELGEE